MFHLDGYRDPEIEEWAARKIQSSFKQYKRQKTGLSPSSLPQLEEEAEGKAVQE